MTEIVDEGEPITSEDVRQTEVRLGIEIPEPYRTFLLDHNGGRPEPDGIKIKGVPGEEADVRAFLALRGPVDYDTIEHVLDLLREGYPHKNVLPIAFDSSDGIFCLDLENGRGFPVVYFEWGGAWKSEPYEPLHVAADFGAFLDMIYQFEWKVDRR